MMASTQLHDGGPDVGQKRERKAGERIRLTSSSSLHTTGSGKKGSLVVNVMLVGRRSFKPYQTFECSS